MTTGFWIYLFAAAIGFVLGWFISIKIVGFVAIALFTISIIGVIVSAATEQNSLTWVFGIAAMAIPFLGGTAFAGALAGRWLRQKLARK